MASIRKRDSSWHVQIRQSGQPSIIRSFKRKPDAVAWARQTEAEIDRRGLYPSRTDLEQRTVGDLLKRYRDEIVVYKRGAKTEQSLIQFLLNRKLAAYSLEHATPDVFRQYRGADVVDTLERVTATHGLPKSIRVDNGPEFLSKDLDL